MVVVRSTPFPRTGKVREHVDKLKEGGDLLVVAEDTCWRTMQALRALLAERAAEFKPEALAEWRLTDAPLTSLPEIASILQRRASEAEVTPVHAEGPLS